MTDDHWRLSWLIIAAEA